MSTTINPANVPKSFFNAQTGELTVDRKLAEQVQAGVLGASEGMPEAQKQVFLSMVANLAPDQVGTPKELGAYLGAFEAASEQVNKGADAPVMAFVGDVAKFLARAMLEQAASERKNALEGRLAAREAAAAQNLDQAEALKDAANKMMTGALTGLILGVVSSAISIGGAAVSGLASLSALSKMSGLSKGANSATSATSAATGQLDKAGDAASVAATAGKAVVDPMAKIDQTYKAFEALSKAIDGVGSMGRASGQGAEGISQAQAKTMEADAQLSAAEAQYAQQAMDMRKEVQDSMKDFMEKIIDFIKQMQDAEVDAMRAITG